MESAKVNALQIPFNLAQLVMIVMRVAKTVQAQQMQIVKLVQLITRTFQEYVKTGVPSEQFSSHH